MKKGNKMKEKNYLNTNKTFWNREYHAPNVEGFIFRLKPKLLDCHIPPKKKLTVLDYGCGEGSNVDHFIRNYKYDGYGVDISEPSIKICKKKINKVKFKLIDSKVNENDNFFNIKFDLIISIQVLYYLNNKDLEKRLLSLNNMLKPGGYVFFTMMSPKNEYFKFSNKKINSDGMTLVDLSEDRKYRERQKGKIYYHYINFCKNKSDLKKKFKIFEPLSIGWYDGSLSSTSLSQHHFTFFGKKRDNK